MKTSKFSALRGALVGALMLSAASAVAATTTGTVILGGSVASTATLTTVATGAASALDLGGVGTDLPEQRVHVADLTMTTNNSGGVTLTVTSDGLLTNARTGSIITYEVLAVDNEAVPLTTDFVASSDSYQTTSTSQAADLYIAYDPAQNEDEGAYSGTISLEIVDNN